MEEWISEWLEKKIVWKGDWMCLEKVSEMQPCVERDVELQTLVKSSVDLLPLEFFFPLGFWRQS